MRMSLAMIGSLSCVGADDRGGTPDQLRYVSGGGLEEMSDPLDLSGEEKDRVISVLDFPLETVVCVAEDVEVLAEDPHVPLESSDPGGGGVGVCSHCRFSLSHRSTPEGPMTTWTSVPRSEARRCQSF